MPSLILSECLFVVQCSALVAYSEIRWIQGNRVAPLGKAEDYLPEGVCFINGTVTDNSFQLSLGGVASWVSRGWRGESDMAIRSDSWACGWHCTGGWML